MVRMAQLRAKDGGMAQRIAIGGGVGTEDSSGW